jgi:uncharacterized protein YkwD
LTSIANLLAALVAVVSVAVGGHPVALRPAPVQHPVGVRLAPSYQEPVGTDDFTWMHGHNNRKVAAPPAPPAPPAPADAPAPAPAPAYVASAPVYHPPAPPPVVVGSTQQALINSDRASAGLAPLTWSSCLAGIAYQNALRMANQGYISHAGGPTQDLGCGLGSRAGENVGYWSAGINDGQLNVMFMNSADHRANIMGPYRYVGTAWVVARNGYAYIAVEFS